MARLTSHFHPVGKIMGVEYLSEEKIKLGVVSLFTIRMNVTKCIAFINAIEGYSPI